MSFLQTKDSPSIDFSHARNTRLYIVLDSMFVIDGRISVIP
jgi:hypothetical protein